MTDVIENAQHLRDAAGRHVLHVSWTPGTPIFWKGKGSRVWDIDGKEYLDSVSGTNGPAMVGHSHSAIAAAVARQMETLAANSYRHDSVPVIEFCARIAAMTPGDLGKTYLCPGGGEAVEAALKFAMLATGKTEVFSLHGAYHGLSLGTTGLCGHPSYRDWMPAGLRWPNFYQVPGANPYRPYLGETADDPAVSLEALTAAIDSATYKQVAAVVLEVVQGPGGHVVLPPSYCQGVEAICRERGILFIVDEVQTGMGRCGALWASDLAGIQPDVLVLGKALGGGVPFGAIVVREELVTDAIEAVPWHVVTFMNQPLQAAAGLAVIDVVESENLVERAHVLGAHACDRLHEMSERYEVIGDIRGPGLFIGIELVEDRDTRVPATEACRAAWEFATENGLLTWFGGTDGAFNVLKFKPPLNTPDDDFEEMLNRIDSTVALVEERVHGRRTMAKPAA